MKNIGKLLKNSICWLSILVVLGFAGGCAKKLLPPDIDGSAGGSNLSADSSGSSGSGMNGSNGSSAFKEYDGPSGNNGSGSGMILSDENLDANDSNFPPTGSGSGMGDGSGNNGMNGSGSGSSGSGSGGSSTDFGANNGSSGAFDSGENTAAMKVFRETNELDDIYFAFDQYSLSEEMKSILKKNAEWLKKNSNIKVEIQGHCDERGTNNYNLGLGERRSLIAKKYLVALGIEEDRIFTISYGEEKPFCFESTKGCWQSNRRDHFMISE